MRVNACKCSERDGWERTRDVNARDERKWCVAACGGGGGGGGFRERFERNLKADASSALRVIEATEGGHQRATTPVHVQVAR